jgi:hypothetical protein
LQEGATTPTMRSPTAQVDAMTISVVVTGSECEVEVPTRGTLHSALAFNRRSRYNFGGSLSPSGPHVLPAD